MPPHHHDLFSPTRSTRLNEIKKVPARSALGLHSAQKKSYELFEGLIIVQKTMATARAGPWTTSNL